MPCKFALICNNQNIMIFKKEHMRIKMSMREANMLREFRDAVVKVGITHCRVTNLRISKDWRYCDVYCISTIDQNDEVMSIILQSKSHSLRQIIKNRCAGHFFPTLRFHPDIEARRVERVDEILKNIEEI